MRAFILLSLLFFTSCLQNDIEIEYLTAPEGTNYTQVLGVWKGTLNCPDCCDDMYNFEVNLKSYNPQTSTFTAEITILKPASEWLAASYAKYHAVGEVNQNTISLSTTEIFEKVTGSCYFCEQNVYEIKIISDTTLKGVWLSSSNCDASVIQSAVINLEKQ